MKWQEEKKAVNHIHYNAEYLRGTCWLILYFLIMYLQTVHHKNQCEREQHLTKYAPLKIFIIIVMLLLYNYLHYYYLFDFTGNEGLLWTLLSAYHRVLFCYNCLSSSFLSLYIFHAIFTVKIKV